MGQQPLYKKIYQFLKDGISTGEFPPDSQLPTELELADMFAVSRITSKRALVELENEGLIKRVRGKGSFVLKPLQQTADSQSNDILLMLPFGHNEGFGNYSEGILAALQGTPYRLNIQPHQDTDKDNWYRLMSDFCGMIYYPMSTRQSIEFLFYSRLNQYPLVLLDKKIESIDYPAIVADNFAGGKLAAEHLIAAGCQHVCFVHTENLSDVSSVRERYLGYLSAVYAHELASADFAVTGNLNEEDFGKEIVQLIQTNAARREKTGLIMENDLLAIKMMSTLERTGVAVPDEAAVVGFDNIQAAALVQPGLTTVSQDFHQMGRQAADLLLAQIESGDISQTVHTVPVQLIIRESSYREE